MLRLACVVTSVGSLSIVVSTPGHDAHLIAMLLVIASLICLVGASIVDAIDRLKDSP